MTARQKKPGKSSPRSQRGGRKPRAPREVLEHRAGHVADAEEDDDEGDENLVAPGPRPGGGPERIQKVLARSGYGSRRKCEELIREGRVMVDGEVVTELGAKADLERQDVRVDGNRVRAERPVYYLLYKPKHVLCTREDREGRQIVFELLPLEKRRLVAVGRLDADSRGALILTNDGAFTNLLTHPRYGIEKTYQVRVRGEIADEAIKRLREGIWLSEGKTLPARVWVIKRGREQSELGVAICEGKNRQVRRMFAKVGHKVLALTRTRIGPLTLKGLSEGAYRELARGEVEQLRRMARQNAQSPPPARQRRTRARSQGKPDPARPTRVIFRGDDEPPPEPEELT